MRKKNKTITNAVVFETASRELRAIEQAKQGSEKILEQVRVWKNTAPEQLAGRLAEEIHTTTFNIDAAAKGSTLRASTTSSLGQPTAHADIVITNGKTVIENAQVKYRATSIQTTFDISEVKYDGMKKVVPTDQLNEVQWLAKSRGVNGLGQKNYADTAKSATDRIEIKNLKSKPLSRHKAIEAAKNPEKFTSELVDRQIKNSMKKGWITGSLVGMALSTVKNVKSVMNGKKDVGDAVVSVAVDTGTAGASGAAVNGLAIVAESTLARAGMQSLAKSALPVVISLTTVEVGKDFYDFSNGKINGEQLAKKTAGNVVKGGTTWGGMEGGAAVGTFICPGVGTLIGGIIGGIGGALIGSWLVD